MSSLLLLALLGPAPAEACGGFFCSQSPIDQSAEQIAFGMDAENNTITMHTRIFYTGSAREFAWVVPVPDNPELFISTDALFTTLQAATQPFFFLNYHFEDCADEYWYGAYADYDLAEADGGGAPTQGGGSPDVTVVSQGQVGPYDTVVLTATNSTSLVEWLQDNEYDIPDAYESVVSPYVAGGSHFVALKLQNDKDTGDISPLGMKYNGGKPSIPIRLTSISATPDMRLEVYLFGDERAVPESYLHVQINEAAVNWFGFGNNYNDVITLAADEAGGHAFATDFSGSAGTYAGILYDEDRYDLDALRQQTTPIGYIDALMSQGFIGSASLLALFTEYIPVPEDLANQGVQPQDFYNCLSCYEVDWSSYPFDPEAMTDALDEQVVQPLKEAEKLFEHDSLSRLTSSLSPTEMTVDPTFAFNPSMGEVSNRHEADLTFLCNDPELSPQDAVRRLDLADGRSILYPPMSWFWDNEVNEADYVSDVAEVNALVVERTGESGDPEIVFDYTNSLNQNIDGHNTDIWDRFMGGAVGKGCGCNVTDLPGTALGGLALLAVAARRRRR